MIVIGIDPGSRRIGYGVIEKSESAIRYITCGILPITGNAPQEYLAEIDKGIQKLLEDYNPKAAAIEKIYLSKNRKTAISVAESRGVIVSACAKRGLRITEHTPHEVKMAVTGYGGADKKAVLKMVKIILREPDLSILDDASDALALAIIGCRKAYG